MTASVCSASVLLATAPNSQPALRRQATKGCGLSHGKPRATFASSIRHKKTMTSRGSRIAASALEDEDLDRFVEIPSKRWRLLFCFFLRFGALFVTHELFCSFCTRVPTKRRADAPSLPLSFFLYPSLLLQGGCSGFAEVDEGPAESQRRGPRGGKRVWN